MVYHSDGFFMYTTTASEIMSITSLGGQPVRGGQVGLMKKTICDGYWSTPNDPTPTFEINYEGEDKQTWPNGVN